MSYEVHIARQKSWADRDGERIERDEWLALVEAEDALTLAAGGGPAAIWTGHPDHIAGREPEGVLFLYSEGRGFLSVNEPDDATVTLMVRIAGQLNAQVRGDDGEIYKLSAEGRVLSEHLGDAVPFAPDGSRMDDGPAKSPYERWAEGTADDGGRSGPDGPTRPATAAGAAASDGSGKRKRARQLLGRLARKLRS